MAVVFLLNDSMSTDASQLLPRPSKRNFKEVFPGSPSQANSRLFAMNWPAVADGATKLGALVRAGYEYNFWS
jgi:hypothetical protein